MKSNEIETKETNREDIGDVPQVEVIVEFNGSGEEGSGHSVVQINRCLDYRIAQCYHFLVKPVRGIFQMLQQN